MKQLLVMPVRHCSHCAEDRPHQVVNALDLTCCTCGTRRGR